MSGVVIREQAARIEELLQERATLYQERHLFVLDAERRRLVDECERLKAALRLRDEQLSRLQGELKHAENRILLRAGNNREGD